MVFYPWGFRGKPILQDLSLHRIFASELTNNEGFPGGSVVKNPPAYAGDLDNMGSVPGVRKIPWRRKGQPTPVFLPGKAHGQGNLMGYSPWGHKRARHNLATEHAHNEWWTQSVCSLYCWPNLIKSPMSIGQGYNCNWQNPSLQREALTDKRGPSRHSMLKQRHGGQGKTSFLGRSCRFHSL